MENYNIGTDVDLKIIKLSKALGFENRQKYITLMKEFPDVFAWSYEDLKEYDTNIIQHTISIKENDTSSILQWLDSPLRRGHSLSISTTWKGGGHIKHPQSSLNSTRFGQPYLDSTKHGPQASILNHPWNQPSMVNHTWNQLSMVLKHPSLDSTRHVSSLKLN